MTIQSRVSIIIFGASGDLTDRKLIPALYNDFRKKRMPEQFWIIGYARTPYSDESYREHLQQGIQNYDGDDFDPKTWKSFADHVRYFVGQYHLPDDYSNLQNFSHDIEGDDPAGRVYYLATVPELFGTIAQELGMAGMADETNGFRRLVIEKPYGTDLTSAHELDKAVHSSFREHQVFRIDHYLGKETAQNILFFRFANTMFEPVWNRSYIDNIQITVEEKVNVGRRGAYYDKMGVLRDMFQNHLLQLLTLVAMEPPPSFQADAVRNEKVKVLSSVRPIRLQDTLRGQYDGYRQTKGAAQDSATATYAALTLYVDNWRWHGVPFYLRSGKALARKASEIIVEFQYPPLNIFDQHAFTPNLLSFCIQPDEGVHIKFQTKVPDSMQETRPVDMDFHYRNQFTAPIPDAYERLLIDVLSGDGSLFPRSDAIDASWRIIDPILKGWSSPDAPPLYSYEPGSWGPLEVHHLLEKDGRFWRIGCACGKGEECA